MQLTVRCNIKQARSKTWICGNNLGYASCGKYMTWDVANPDERGQVIDDVTARLNASFISLAERFAGDLQPLVADIVEKGFFPNYEYVTNVPFVLEYGTNEQARQSAQNYYNALLFAAKKNFQRALAEVRSGQAATAYRSDYLLALIIEKGWELSF